MASIGDDAGMVARTAPEKASGMRWTALRRGVLRVLATAAMAAVAAALEGLAALDRELTAAAPKARIALRLRAAALAISEELAAYPEFYEQGNRT